MIKIPALLMEATTIFLFMVIVDVAWAFYIKTVAQGKMWAASRWSAFIMMAQAFVVVGYVENKWMILPAALGAFVGTAIGMLIKGEGRG